MIYFNPVKFGEKIQQLRRKKKWRQDDLAEKLELTRVSISNYEKGRAVPTVQTLALMAQLFGTSTDSLLGLDQKHTDSRLSSENHQINKAIRTERRHQNLSQTELARQIHCDQKTLSKYETGYQRVPENQLEKIIQALGLTLPAFRKKYHLTADTPVNQRNDEPDQDSLLSEIVKLRRTAAISGETPRITYALEALRYVRNKTQNLTFKKGLIDENQKLFKGVFPHNRQKIKNANSKKDG